MYHSIYPYHDATIYENHPLRNTGIDQILQLSKFAIGTKYEDDDSIWGGTYNSRILIKFNLNELSQSIVSGKISSSAKYYLKLYTVEADNLPINHVIYAYPISSSWTNGNGNYNDVPERRDGVSWKYTGQPSSIEWKSGSGVSISYQTNSGGGNWYTNAQYICSQSYDYENPDMNMDITRMVNGWLSNSIPNNGLILKRSLNDESGSSVYGNIKYFSKDTHTIYVPRLNVFWDDSNYSGISRFEEIGDYEYSVNPKNIHPQYKKESVARFRFGVRKRYPTKTYATSSYLNSKRLPTSSYYSVLDYATRDVVIPFDNTGTKISCDNTGNYFDLRMDSFMPERYYELLIKVERNGGNLIDILTDSYIFRVMK